MKIGVLGTGPVGSNIATKLLQLGNEVMMGSRDRSNAKAVAWAKKSGKGASNGTFADAAGFGEMIFNCTMGTHSIEALKSAGEENMNGKILVDVANPLDFSEGILKLTVANTDSLAEEIQRAFPKVKVVKTLNTVMSDVQVDPSLLPEDHAMFISGNDAYAKSKVKELLKSFGWKSIIDLGDIKAARAQEALLLLWSHLYRQFPDDYFNYKVVTKKR